MAEFMHCTAIEAVAADGNLNEIITTAIETFSAFEIWFEEKVA